jgi:16S rRNA processing protein RimM
LEYIKIGYIRKPHGTKGEMKVEIEERFVDDFFETDVVFIEVTGSKLPHFVAGIRDAGFLLLTLEDYESRSAVELLSKKSVFLRRSDISLSDEQLLAGEESPLTYHYLEGFALYDVSTAQWVGTIRAVLAFPHQEMAEIQAGERQILVPIQPTWIVDIDKAGKKIKMELPEGLLDL